MFVDEFKRGAWVAVFPAVYVGIAYNKLPQDEQDKLFSLTHLLIALPFVYGFVFAFLKGVLPPSTSLFVLGSIAGLLYSLGGHYGLHIPERVFKSKHPNRVHVLAPLLYALIYGYLV